MSSRNINILTIVLVVLIGINVIMMVRNQNPIIIDAPKETIKIKEVQAPRPRREPRRSPEYRGPPYRQYQPKNFQIIGLLSNGTDTLPLYGRASQTRRNMWNYYSATPGQQIYPLPVTHSDRDCVDQDVGCPEFYGGETVTVSTKPGNYTVEEIYDVKQIPYIPYV